MIADAKVRVKHRKARLRAQVAAQAGIDLADKIPIIEGARMLGVPYSTLHYWISQGQDRTGYAVASEPVALERLVAYPTPEHLLELFA